MPLPSKRDTADLRDQLTRWLARLLPRGANPELSSLSVPEGTGMSSETFLFDAHWREDGETRGGSYVARMGPDMNDFPAFPEYDLSLQVECLRFVAEKSDVPVPKVAWTENDPSVVGTPFYVMERIDGTAPTDVPPYVFGGWLIDAEPERRAELQRSSVGILAKLHGIRLEDRERKILDRPQYGASPMDQHLGYQRAYYHWAREGVSFRCIEHAFDWLDANRPTDPGPGGLNWGDARIGNILFRDFVPVAVLDWEMAALGPPEVDLAWMVQMHAFFAGFTEALDLPGLPGFMERDAVISHYEQLTGHSVRDFDWYFVFAALRFMIVSIRTSMRAIAYGQMEKPEDPEEMIINRNQVVPFL